MVRASLAGMRPPLTKRDRRLDDIELAAVIRHYWDETDGSATRMLRLLRDEMGIACEQKRFAVLFRQLKQQHEA